MTLCDLFFLSKYEICLSLSELDSSPLCTPSRTPWSAHGLDAPSATLPGQGPLEVTAEPPALGASASQRTRRRPSRCPQRENQREKI